MKNWVAFIPVHRAVEKWPSSCRKMAINTPTTNTSHQMLNSANTPIKPTIAATPSAPRSPPTSSSSGFSTTDPPAITSLVNRPVGRGLGVSGGGSSWVVVISSVRQSSFEYQ